MTLITIDPVVREVTVRRSPTDAFRLFTEEEEKVLSKNYGSIKKQVDNAFKQAAKKK